MQDESAPPPYRPAFAAALGLFARASEDMKALGFLPPVLVGGAAVEFYSGSTISTGDFDIVTARQDQFEDILRKHRRESFARVVLLIFRGDACRDPQHGDLTGSNEHPRATVLQP